MPRWQHITSDRAMISIILNTARSDRPMVGVDWFIFEPTVKSLNKQRNREFELIIVDALYSERRKRWLEEHAEFPLKYVDAFPNRFLENGMVAIASMKNKGILYAEGDLVVFLDDCTQLPEWWTEKIDRWFSKGYWPMSLTYYYEGGRPKLLKPDDRYVEKFTTYMNLGEMVRDSRADVVNKAGVLPSLPQWFYGGSSVSLDALLEVNGLNELFDGSKGLEDVSLGIRLDLAGYKGLFVLDKSLYHFEHWHGPVDEKVVHYKGPTPKCNYALLLYEQTRRLYRANTYRITEREIEWIQENVCNRCPNRARCLNEEFGGRWFIPSEAFDRWLSQQRTFDLREERLEL